MITNQELTTKNTLTPTTTSDFQQLLESLRKETSMTAEIVSRIYRYAQNLKQLPEQKANPCVAEPEPVGVIQMFTQETRNLRRLNEQLQYISDHLAEVIGA